MSWVSVFIVLLLRKIKASLIQQITKFQILILPGGKQFIKQIIHT